MGTCIRLLLCVQQEYDMPTGTADLANYNSQISSGPIPTPIVRRFHSYSSGSSSTKVQPRSRSMGVRFLSPAKSKSPENLEINNSTDQLKNSDDTRQDAVLDHKRATVISGAPFSESNNEQFIDSSLADGQQSTPSPLENSLRSLSSSKLLLDLPSLARVEPVNDSALTLTQQQNGKSKSNATVASGSMFIQTKLSAFTKPIDSTLNTNATAIVQSKYFTEKTILPAISLSLEEEPVTCARVVPLESLKLGRNGHIKRDEGRDGPMTIERLSDRCRKTTDSGDTEDSREISYETELVDKTTALVPASSERYQDSVTHAQPHVSECVEEITNESRAYYGEMQTDSNTCTSSPSTCARLMPAESIKVRRSGQDDPIAKESDTSPSPNQEESMETEEVNLAEAKAADTEVIDLTHLVDSQSPSPKSPQANASTLSNGFQNVDSSLQRREHSTAVFTDGSNDHHNGQGSNLRRADSANVLTPLPKLGSPKATSALYGKEPSKRSQNSGSGTKRKQLRSPLTFLNDPFGSPSSLTTSPGSDCLFRSLLQSPASKRLKLSTGKEDNSASEIQTTTSTMVAARSRRILPAFLQPGHTSEQNIFSKNHNHSCDGYSRGQVDASAGVCVCGCSETHQRVPMCRQCCSSIINLNRSGLFGRLSKLDLSSPEICQVHKLAYAHGHLHVHVHVHLHIYMVHIMCTNVIYSIEDSVAMVITVVM